MPVKPKPTSRSNTILGLICLLAGAAVIFLWVPFDTVTGIVEVARGEYTVGDGLAPTLAGVFILLAGLTLVIAERSSGGQAGLSLSNFYYICGMYGIIFVGAVGLRFAGPLAVSILTEAGEYRLLRDTTPWKHIGFVLGGTIIITGMISFVEGRITWRGVLTGIVATFAFIALYDLPFDDLLLPPNGDF